MIAGTALVALAGLWAALALLAIALPAVGGAAAVFGLACLALALADALILVFTPLPRCERLAPPVMSLGRTVKIRLILRKIHPRIRSIRLFDAIPDQVRAPGLPLKIAVKRKGFKFGELEARYELMPVRRGSLRFGSVHLRFGSVLGLWQRAFRSGVPFEAKVFPAFLKDERSALALVTGQASPDSVRPVRRRGQGMEFLQLRDFRDGDSLRLVDWKATSRMRKLIVKELQEEQNQEIIFLLDTGYRMFASEGGAASEGRAGDDIQHFDRALESLLYLAHVALKQGDAVGVMTFGPTERWIAPVKGRSSMNLLLSRLYDLEASPEPASPAAALERLAGRLKRRSLIIVMSNLREEDSDSLGGLLPLLARNHLVLTLWIRENVVQSLLTPPFRSLADALTAAAARLYLDERQRLQDLWKKKGIHVLDTSPQSLTASLVNTYWDLKKSGAL